MHKWFSYEGIVKNRKIIIDKIMNPEKDFLPGRLLLIAWHEVNEYSGGG